MQVTFRSGTAADAPACGRIGYQAFKAIAEQHNFPPDFSTAEVAIGLYAMILGRSDIFSIVGEHDGQIVCSNFLWEGDAIAGVGPITVLPSAQNTSLGRRLMQSVLDRAESRNQSEPRQPFPAQVSSYRPGTRNCCTGAYITVYRSSNL